MCWWLLDDTALTAAALILMINLLFLGWLSVHEPKVTQPSHTPKSQRMPKSQWIKAYLKLIQGPNIHWPSKRMTTTSRPRSRRSGYPLGYKRKMKRKSTPHTIVEAFPMTYKENQNKAIQWDTDGQQLMVDNGVSVSITPYLTDFITPPQPINSKVKGIRGHAQATYEGTIQWKIQDDQGQSHRFTLPNSYFIAKAPSRILCPQHLAQTAKDNFPLPLGTGEVTGDEYIQLFWNQRKYVKTIKLDPRRNIGVTHDMIYIKTQVFRLLRYYSPAPRNIARSDWVTQNITHNMTSSIT